MKRLTLLVVLGLLATITHGQKSYTVSGTVTDAASGEFLIGANIYITTTGQGTTTNKYGFYSLTVQGLESGGIRYSYLGYQMQIKKIPLQDNLRLDIELFPEPQAMDEVVVTADSRERNVQESQMGVIDIPPSKIMELPVILGEPDVLKVLQLLPGVQQGNEGTTGYLVRGGNIDQNLVLLDEAIVYNPNHVVGLISTFNARAINNVSLVKGGFPAQYGGRLSSILNISLKEGNTKEFTGEGGIGLISSQLTLEGPIKENESSFIVSGRRSYFDVLIKPFLSSKVKTNYLFYDLNAKINYKIGGNDRIYLSGFLAKDDAFYSQDAIEYNLLLDNSAVTLRWNHIFGPKVFANTSLIYSSYRQDITALQDNAFSTVRSGIDDLSAKFQLEYYPGQTHKIQLGAQYMNHTFRSGGDSRVFANTNQDPQSQLDSVPVKTYDEIAIYASDDLRFSDKFSMNFGLRAPGFFNNNVSYFRVEPRVAARYSLDASSSLKAAYSTMHQFIHQVPSTAAAVPTDIWIPSSSQTGPQRSEQYSLGYFRNFSDNKLEGSAELYYKSMDDQILFREGNQLISSLDVDDLLVYGKGWSYGAEFFLKKKWGPISGWASYTLAWTYQKFPELNFGEKFPFRHDRRHDLSLVANFELNNRWTFGGTFVFSSGNTYTVPVGRTSIVQGGSLFEGNYYLYEERNNARLKPYHRLNLSATYKKPRTLFGQKYRSEWVFSIYNVYSRQNPYFIFFDINPITEEPRARQVSLLPIIPSVSYNFKF